MALGQVALICYSILFVGLVLRIRYGHTPPPDLFATHIRNFGVVLFVVPLIWSSWAVISENRSEREHRPSSVGLLFSGITVILALLVVAFFATMSALVHDSLLIPVPSGQAVENTQPPTDN